MQAEAIPDNDPELLVKKAQNVDIVVATMEPWNETTLGAVKGKSKIYSKIWNRSRLCRFKSCRKKWDSCC